MSSQVGDLVTLENEGGEGRIDRETVRRGAGVGLRVEDKGVDIMVSGVCTGELRS